MKLSDVQFCCVALLGLDSIHGPYLYHQYPNRHPPVDDTTPSATVASSLTRTNPPQNNYHSSSSKQIVVRRALSSLESRQFQKVRPQQLVEVPIGRTRRRRIPLPIIRVPHTYRPHARALLTGPYFQQIATRTAWFL